MNTYINLPLLGMCKGIDVLVVHQRKKKGIDVLDTVSDFLNPKGNFCFHNKIGIYLFGR